LTLSAALWIAVGPSFPTREGARGFSAFLYRTIELIGPAAATALGVAIAFLAGTVAVELVRVARGASGRAAEYGRGLVGRIDSNYHMRRYAADKVRRRRAFAQAEYEIRPIIESVVDQIPESIIREVALEASEMIHEIMGPKDEVKRLAISELRTRLSEFYFFRAESTESRLAVRLRVENKDLWDDYDRWTSEGEFRVSVAPALAAVFAAASFQWTPWALTGLLACLLLLRQGANRNERGRSVVVQALVNGALTLPDIEAVKLKVANASRSRVVGA